MPTNTCSNRGLPDIYHVYQYGTAQVMCKLNDQVTKLGRNDM